MRHRLRWQRLGRRGMLQFILNARREGKALHEAMRPVALAPRLRLRRGLRLEVRRGLPQKDLSQLRKESLCKEMTPTSFSEEEEMDHLAPREEPVGQEGQVSDHHLLVQVRFVQRRQVEGEVRHMLPERCHHHVWHDGWVCQKSSRRGLPAIVGRHEF